MWAPTIKILHPSSLLIYPVPFAKSKTYTLTRIAKSISHSLITSSSLPLSISPYNNKTRTREELQHLSLSLSLSLSFSSRMNLQHILSSFFILLTVLTSIIDCLSPDGLSLLAFKSAVSSDPLSSLACWKEDDPDPCRWPSVSCANISGSSSSPRVVGIAVSGKNLSGYIPSELGNLIFLRRLNLHGNRLSGSIPSALFNASSLRSIVLYDNNLTGTLPPELCNLPRIQNLDLSRNLLSGPISSDLRNCRQLQRLLLAQNRFSGQIPAGIWPEMLSLVQLDLSSNNLSGPLPPDIGDLNSLSGTLNLSHNHFSGKIPSSLGNLPASVSLDLRYNNLSGKIAQTGSLANQGPTAFLNNPSLCGFPLQIQCENSPASPPPNQLNSAASVDNTQEKSGLRPSKIILISVADAAGVALIGLVLVFIYWKVKDRDNGCSCTGTKKLGGSKGDGDMKGCCICWRPRGSWSEEEGEEEESENERENGEGRLVAIDKGFKFELDELLRASAYVLGKSGLGIVYKVVLGNGVPVAVRRLGEGGGQRYKEFAAEVQAIGRVRHQNVVRLRAYYWAPDETLLITDFVSNGSLASALRGRPGQPSLSWSIRLKIAKGAARGLAHIHECSPRKFVHGDVKPSNILIDGEFNPYISDFGLTSLINIAGNDPTSSSSSSLGFIGGAFPATKPATIDRPNNYRAPEARIPGSRPTQKWDVYSFGVVLLEMLTGKAPDTTSTAVATTSTSPAEDLVRWVRQGFDDAKPLSEIVDPELNNEVHAKNGVVSMFHIALACTESDPEVRPRMKTVSDNLDRAGS